MDHTYFDWAIGHFVPRGAIAVTRYQRKKKYHLKTYHSYYVEAHVPVHYYSVSSLLNEKFNFRTKAAGADDVFEKLSDALLTHLYPQNFVSQTGMYKPPGVLLSGPLRDGKDSYSPYNLWHAQHSA